MKSFALSVFVLILSPLFASAQFSPDELTRELNSFRAANGLPPMTTDPQLCQTCQSWSFHLASTGGFYHGGGEHVIAWGHSSPGDVIRGWMNSPGHRAWLLSGNTACGWGMARGRDGRLLWAGAFGCPGGTCGPVAAVASTFRATVTPYRLTVRERHRFLFRRR